MLVKLVVNKDGEIWDTYITFPEDSANLLKISSRKLKAINREWRKRSEGLASFSEIFDVLYKILEERGIEWSEGGLGAVLMVD